MLEELKKRKLGWLNPVQTLWKNKNQRSYFLSVPYCSVDVELVSEIILARINIHVRFFFLLNNNKALQCIITIGVPFTGVCWGL